MEKWFLMMQVFCSNWFPQLNILICAWKCNSFEHLCNICMVTQKWDIIAHLAAKERLSLSSVLKRCRCTTGQKQTQKKLFNFSMVQRL